MCKVLQCTQWRLFREKGQYIDILVNTGERLVYRRVKCVLYTEIVQSCEHFVHNKLVRLTYTLKMEGISVKVSLNLSCWCRYICDNVHHIKQFN